MLGSDKEALPPEPRHLTHLDGPAVEPLLGSGKHMHRNEDCDQTYGIIRVRYGSCMRPDTTLVEGCWSFRWTGFVLDVTLHHRGREV